jgi:ComF family protein
MKVNFLAHLYMDFKRLVLPTFCVFCKKQIEHSDVLCGTCRGLLRPVTSAQLRISKKITIPVAAATCYEFPIKRLILAKRYRDISMANALGELLWRYSSVSSWDFDYVVPVPLHWTRLAWRGYNQAEHIAKIIARMSKKPLCKVLVRTRYTTMQAVLSAKGRCENVAGVFSLAPRAERYAQARFLLIDDVLTSGATLSQAAKTLLLLKPTSIKGAVVCRTI